MHLASRPPLRRLAAIDRMIRGGTYPNAATAARELEVCARTVHRDLEFLRDSLHAPLAFSHARNGYYYTDHSFALPCVPLTELELVGLFLAERLLQTYEGTPYAADLAAVFAKLTAGLPAHVTIDLGHLDEAFSFRPQGPAAAQADDFRRLSRAIREGQRLELVYWTASRDRTCRRVVDPYHLASIDGHWYLVGYCHLREDVRMFVPGRIRQMRETGERFERPADFRIADYLDGSFRAVRGSGPPRRVRLRFAPAAARYVRERSWHPTQRLKERGDGGVELTLRLTHFLEVKRWALSYGADCEVLEPAALREEVREAVRRMGEVYG
jgi:proteasome accessory factor B